MKCCGCGRNLPEENLTVMFGQADMRICDDCLRIARETGNSCLHDLREYYKKNPKSRPGGDAVPLYQQVFDAIQDERYPRHYADYAATHKGVAE